MHTSTSNLFGTAKDKLILAIDNVKTIHEAEDLIEKTSPYVGWYKAGLETIIAFGSKTMIDLIRSYGGKSFLDGKFHDIPNTVGNASGKIALQHADMMDLHCCNGITAMKAAVEKNISSIILGITVLTSHSEEECRHIFGTGINEKVLQFAYDAKEAGLHGVVCSPKELTLLSGYPELNNLFKITPGIQPEFMQKNDQKRVMTPAGAIKCGATALVIGRAITESDKPKEAARMIVEEISEAMASNIQSIN